VVRVARTIERKVRADDHVGRYGGEEFVVIAPGLALSGPIDLAERIRPAVAHQSHPHRDGEAVVSLSAGVAAFPDVMSTAAELFDGADTAMYQAKTAGGNRIVVAGRALATFNGHSHGHRRCAGRRIQAEFD
jgi:diguanylate cyclase